MISNLFCYESYYYILYNLILIIYLPPKYVPEGNIIRHLDWYDPGLEGVIKSVLNVMVHPGSSVVVGNDVQTEMKSPPLN